jgi:hypothetical protein
MSRLAKGSGYGPSGGPSSRLGPMGTYLTYTEADVDLCAIGDVENITGHVR